MKKITISKLFKYSPVVTKVFTEENFQAHSVVNAFCAKFRNEAISRGADPLNFERTFGEDTEEHYVSVSSDGARYDITIEEV